jgi:porin
MTMRSVRTLVRNALSVLPLFVGIARAAAADDPAASPVRPALSAMVEAWQNAHGGLRTGGWWNSLVSASVEVDGSAVGAPRNSRFAAKVNWAASRDRDADFASLTGALSPVSGTMAADHVRVFTFDYRMDAPGGGWALKVGQLAVDDDFMLSEFAGLFMNAAFGSMPSPTSTRLGSRTRYGNAFALFPVAAPGIWFQLQGPGAATLQTGIYHGGPGPDERDNWGFEYASLRESGVLVFSELRWMHEVAGHAATSRFGVSAHTGRFDDLRAAERGKKVRDKRGLYSVYWVNDLVLVADGAKPRLGAFARVGISPQRDRTAVLAYGDAGLNWIGPVRGRDDDVAGVAVSASRFSGPYRTVEDSAETETAVELTYKLQVSKRLSVQADAQILFQPARNVTTGSRDTALVIGMRTALEF